MINYTNIRRNMVECQIRTNSVTDEAVLSAFGSTPRELFLPEPLRGAAYVDEDIVLRDVGIMLEPLVHARMLQAAAPKPDDIALCIGDCTGYASAILASLVTTVVTLEEKAGVLDRARKLWIGMDICNIALIRGRPRLGCPEHAPYSLIFIGGAIPAIPQNMIDQLAPEGRIAAVLRESDRQPAGVITVLRKEKDGLITAHSPYGACTPYLREFTPSSSFIF
ncbi:MAG: protein-L-isoaspartate O-methyltransferase [Proteobacteria bacterium]|nr:protein-L-isoaspartate O-methyltransferase [Pseudomonadota bacterium]